MASKTLLWLDDIRNPFDKDFTSYVALYNPFLNQPHEITWVKNYEEFNDYIEFYGLPDAVSFDYDLADEHYSPLVNTKDYKEKTGLDCVKLMVGYCKILKKKLPICIFHTANPVGKVNMETYIENAKKHLEL